MNIFISGGRFWMKTVPTAAVNIKAGCMKTTTMKYTSIDLTKSCNCGMRYRAAIPRDPAAKRTMIIFSMQDDCQDKIC